MDKAARPAASGENAETAFLRYVREKIHLLKRRQAFGKVENSTGFLREAISQNYANPEFAQEERRRKATEIRRDKKARDGQKKQLEGQLEILKTARNAAVSALQGAIADEAPGVLETALPDIFAEQPFLRQFYKSDQSALENYRATIMFQAALNPYLERYAPERIQALKEQYAAQIATVEEQIAALQSI